MTDPDLKPLPEGVLETLRKVSTSTIATQLYKRGFRQPQLLGVKLLSTVVDGFVGEAFTMRFIPAREDVERAWTPIAAATRCSGRRSNQVAARAGAGGGQPGATPTGGVRRGHADDAGVEARVPRAVVTDGGLRDGHVLSQLPFPTYAAAVTITTRAAWHHVADLQVPIGCAGVAVYPGDVLVADRDGMHRRPTGRGRGDCGTVAGAGASWRRS